MGTVTLQAIKQANFRSVFKVIAENSAVSRSVIAEKTELSLMTVGKIADTLLSQGGVRQIKESQNHAGRRAGQLMIDHDRYLLVHELSKDALHLSLFDLCLTQKEQHIIPLNKPNPTQQLKDLYRKIISDYGENQCCAVGLSLPFSPFAEDTINCIENLQNEHFRSVPFLKDSQINFAAHALARNAEGYEEKNVLCWITENNHWDGAYFVGGDLFFGRNGKFAEIGKLCDTNGLSLSSHLSSANAEEFEELFTANIANTLRILHPHTLVFASDHPTPILWQSLTEKLISKFGFSEDELPEFKEEPYDPSLVGRGLAIRLRELWIDRVALSD